MLTGLSDDELVALMATVGTHQKTRPLKPYEVSDLLLKAKQYNSLDTIKATLQLKDSTVLHDFLSLQRLPTEIRALTDWGAHRGKLSFSTSARLSKIDDASLRSRLAESIIQHQLSKDEAGTILQRMRRGHVGLSQALDEILRLRPVIEYNHIYVGKLPSGISEPEQAKTRIRRFLVKHVGAKNVVAVALTSDAYVFVLTDHGKQQIDASPSNSAALSPSNMDSTIAGIVASNE